MSDFKFIVVDSEANGLLKEVTEDYCTSIYDLESGEVVTFSQNDGRGWQKKAFDVMRGAKMLSLHNGVGYDFWLYQKLHGCDWGIGPDYFMDNNKVCIFDTMLISQIVNPDRKLSFGVDDNGKTVKLGKHSVQSYAVQFGDSKVAIDYWDRFEPIIVERCEKDTILQAKIHNHLFNKMGLNYFEFVENKIAGRRVVIPAKMGLGRVDNWKGTDFSNALSMEHKFFHIFSKQENQRGIILNQSKCEKYIDEVSKLIKKCEDELDPILPMLPDMVDAKLKGVQETAGVKDPKTITGKLKKSSTEWFDPLITEVVKKKGQARKDGTIPTRTYVMPEISYDPTEAISGPYCRVGWFKLELTSPEQVCKLLFDAGWVPDEYNKKKVTEKESTDPSSPYFGQVVGKPARDSEGQPVLGSPKLTESSFESISGGAGKLVADMRTYRHRLSVWQGFQRIVDEVGEVHQGGLTHGAVSGRVQHRGIVNVPVRGLYGKQCREVLEAPKDYYIFGADLSAIEDRIKANYIIDYPQGKAYADRILDPTFDTHTNNQQLWGLESRSDAKGPAYALAYNCGHKALMPLMKCTEDVALQRYELYWNDNLPLKLYNEDLKKFFKKYKYVVGIDGRKLTPRSAHSCSNATFQSAANMVAKVASCFMDTWVSKNKLNAWQWSHTHDEQQFCVHKSLVKNIHKFKNEEDAVALWKSKISVGDFSHTKPSHIGDEYWVFESDFATLMIQSFLKAGQFLGIKVPTTGECMAGFNWYHTH